MSSIWEMLADRQPQAPHMIESICSSETTTISKVNSKLAVAMQIFVKTLTGVYIGQHRGPKSKVFEKWTLALNGSCFGSHLRCC